MTTTLWILSLTMEAGVLIRMRNQMWRRLFPGFYGYLLFDLLASVALFGINQWDPGAYDLPWRLTQILLMLGRVLVVMESYQRLAALSDRWRFSAEVIIGSAAAAGLILHIVTTTPLEWPGSHIENIFNMIATSNAILGFVMLGILAAAWEQGLGPSTQYRHAGILAAYLLLTSPCYYAAAHHPDRTGAALMLIAVFCYGAWLFLKDNRFKGTHANW